MTIRVRHHGEERQFESIADIRAALGDGRLEAADEVWHPLSEEWRALSDVIVAAPELETSTATSTSSSLGVEPDTTRPAPSGRSVGVTPTTPYQPPPKPRRPLPPGTKLLLGLGIVVSIGLVGLVAVLVGGKGHHGGDHLPAATADAPSRPIGPGHGGVEGSVGRDDACARIPCSGHGTCVVVRDTPTCACDPEYRPDGLNCVGTPPPYPPTTPLPPMEQRPPASSSPMIASSASIAPSSAADGPFGFWCNNFEWITLEILPTGCRVIQGGSLTGSCSTDAQMINFFDQYDRPQGTLHWSILTDQGHQVLRTIGDSGPPVDFVPGRCP
ncbi:MAG: hypothetical protein HY905_15760 [Deltaproteobacteria bacterium]|nr:hypothetical protein [Deltaproteobacteria bacterium]